MGIRIFHVGTLPLLNSNKGILLHQYIKENTSFHAQIGAHQSCLCLSNSGAQHSKIISKSSSDVLQILI